MFLYSGESDNFRSVEPVSASSPSQWVTATSAMVTVAVMDSGGEFVKLIRLHYM